MNRRRVFGVAVVLTFLAAALRVWGLSSPPGAYFDEELYVGDVQNAYLHRPINRTWNPEWDKDVVTAEFRPEVTIDGELRTWMHPPLGKELMAFGLGVLPERAVGWRLASGIAGIVTVLLVYGIALALSRSVAWGGLAGGLVALDGLSIVQSRMAMLEALLTMFVTAGALCLVLDRVRGPSDPPGRLDRWFGTRWRLLSGVCFGCALATKVSGAFALIAAAALAELWTREGTLSGGSARGRTLALSFVVVPAAVYFLAYAPFWLQHGPDLPAWLTLQVRMITFGLTWNPGLEYASHPASWLLLLRPVRYWSEGSRSIVAIGNPVLWWGFLVALPWLLWRSRSSWQVRTMLVFAGAMFVPWFFAGRQAFIYYMTPVVPFLAGALALGLKESPEHIRSSLLVAVSGCAAVAAVALLPVWLGLSVPRPWLDAIAWLLRGARP